MKTRIYFEKKLKGIKAELKKEIKLQFYSKLRKGQYFCNVEESNRIDFENNVTGTKDTGLVDYICIHNNIIVYPVGSDLDPIDLNCIENVHDLMLLHYIALNDLVI